jgi:transcriptional regulator with XRE-family HTH domain
MTVKQRLGLFIDYLGISTRAFEKKCGLSNGLVNNIKKSISPNTIDKISAIYPELNMGWLLAEEGKMLKNDMPEFKDGKRITKLVEYFNVSVNQFAKKLELSTPQILYDVIKGRNGISRDLAEKIARHYREINCLWILTGEGEMIIPSKKGENGTRNEINTELQERITFQEKMLIELTGIVKEVLAVHNLSDKKKD